MIGLGLYIAYVKQRHSRYSAYIIPVQQANAKIARSTQHSPLHATWHPLPFNYHKPYTFI